jgi:MFS family permease
MTLDMGITLSQGSWFVFSYVLGLAALLLPMGKMAKNHRVKRFMVFGTALFGISSLMCGLSDNFWMLILFRLIQGAAAAMMSSVLPSMIVNMLPIDRKGLGISIMGGATGAALIAGPVLGGILTSALSWHWIFFINIPLCALIIVLAVIHIPNDSSPDPEKDPTHIGGISAMVFIGAVLTILEDVGDPHLQVEMRIICAILIAISLPTLVWSIRRDARRAVIAPQILVNKEYLLVGASFLLCTIVVAGATYLLPYLLQDFWLLSPFNSSLLLSVISVAMMIVVIPVGYLCDRYGCKVPAMMAIIMRALFCILMVIMIAGHVEPILLLIPLVAFGISHAFSGTAQPTRMIHHSTPGYEDESTNFMMVINYVASALGCVFFAMIYSITTASTASVSTPEDLATGFTANMWFSLILLALAMVCTLVVKNKIVKKE